MITIIVHKRPVCCKKFGNTFKLYGLLLIQINNDLKIIETIEV